jgi:tetratricopeptide (TPR) repeat protein
MYLGILHSQYYFHLTSPSLPQPSPPSSPHLISLLLAARVYLSLASSANRNTPNGYLHAANVELELMNLRSNGKLPPTVPLYSSDLEMNLLKAIELNNHLESLQKQGVPVQDTIDSSSAYNQLGLFYTAQLSSAEATAPVAAPPVSQPSLCLLQEIGESSASCEGKQEHLPPAVMAKDAFLKSISLNPKRYEPKMNLGTLFSQLGHYSEAMEMLTEVLMLFEKENGEGRDRNPPAAVWNAIGNVQENLKKYREAGESYRKAMEELGAAAGGGGGMIEHPSAEIIRRNLKRVQGLLIGAGVWNKPSATVQE